MIKCVCVTVFVFVALCSPVDKGVFVSVCDREQREVCGCVDALCLWPRVCDRVPLKFM